MVPVPPAEEGNVSVVVRVRPPIAREGNRKSVVQVVSDCVLVFDPEEPGQPGILAGFQGHDSAPRRKGKDQKFAFDRVFSESATQVEVFENTTKDILDGFLNGYNCSVFAYGATGAGKTHTMLGSEKDPGIMYLTMAELYKKIEARKGQKYCEVLISYQEVYNEQIHDLLQPKGPLAVREDPEKGVVVPGLSFHQPQTAEQLVEMLARGNRNRTQHPTDINAASSRSHAIFQIYMKQHDGLAGAPRNLQVTKMSLIDLAGSERASVTNTKGERLREGANINRSLLALINVINALADAKSKKAHIPYRDSKLTRLLKDSIGGNCRTVMIAAVSPSAFSYEDTYNTLKYANRAKEIKLLMKSNVPTMDCHTSQYATICEQLKAEVADLQRRLRAYEEKDLPVNPQVPAHSGPEQAAILRVKEVSLGHACDREVEVELEPLKPSCGASSLGECSLKGRQESEEKPGCSSTESSNPVKQWGKVSIGQQEMDRMQLERLVKAILSIAQKQYTVLRAAHLLTPEMITEFEELDRLVPQESQEVSKSPATENQREEPPRTPEVVLPLTAPLLVNDAEHACQTDCSVSPAATIRILPPPGNVFKRRRRKSAGSLTPSERIAPSVQKGQAKRRRKAGIPAQQVDSPKEWAVPARADCTSTPFAERTKSSPTDPRHPQPCPLMVTKGRVPLAPSAAQNCSTSLPPRGQNAAFDLGKDPCPAAAPEFPAWESIQQFPNPQGVPLIPRASMPVFTMKGSSISRSASLASRTSTQKRRHAAGSASHSRSAPRSRIARLQGSSLKTSRAVDASAPGVGYFNWRRGGQSDPVWTTVRSSANWAAKTRDRAMASFGAVGVFDPKTETWLQYAKRFRRFVLTNAIDGEERKRAVFLTTVGPEVFRLLTSLLAPIDPTSKTLEELIQVLANHFEPAPSIRVERFHFYNRVRKEGEAFKDFVGALQTLAQHCGFGPTLEDMLCDRLVCGIQHEAVQRRLLARRDLTLAKAIEIAQAMEMADKGVGELQVAVPPAVKAPTASPPPVPVHRFPRGERRRPQKPQPAKSREQTGRCFRRGSAEHVASACRAANFNCFKCGKKGHLARACMASTRSTECRSPKVHQHQEPRSPSSAGGEEEPVRLGRVKAIGKAPPPIIVRCLLAGQHVDFELDSGAPYTLVSAATFQRIEGSLPPLKKFTLRLQSFTHHPIRVSGEVEVPVSFQGGEVRTLPLLVVQHDSADLVGRNWLFAPGLGWMAVPPVHLELKEGVAPKFWKTHPVPYVLRDEVDSELERLVQQGILKPVKTANWAAPVVPVVKANGAIRWCRDFKVTVNAATELEKYPLPRIEDLFAQIGNGTSFSKLDLQDAYCQLELDEQSRNLVVVNTPRGLFQYTRLPFGVASAPAIFQREMEKLLQGLPGASVYDLLVTGADTQQHLKNLGRVLARLEGAGCRLNKAKCQFLQPSVEYLGHRVDAAGLHPVASKLGAIERAPALTNVDELRSFIGLVTYYSKFLPDMATKLAPLYRLLKKQQPWVWAEQEKKVFEWAKRALLGSSMRVHFDNRKPVVLACDASPYGLGAVLSHQTAEGEQPIAFASRSLSKAERNYSQIEREALAMVFGVGRFKNCLLGRHFTLVTDHCPLVSLLSEKKPMPAVVAACIQRWALTLAAYSYSIVHRKAAQLGHADACSRLPVGEEATSTGEPSIPPELVLSLRPLSGGSLSSQEVAWEVEKEPLLRELKGYIRKGWPAKASAAIQLFWQFRQELSVEQGVILRGTRVFIPLRWREVVLEELHQVHQGMSALKALAWSAVWWFQIDRDIENLVQGCQNCQEHASMPPAEHVPWPRTEVPWDRVHVDHAGPVDGHMLLIAVDAATKWIEAVPVSSTSSTATITTLREMLARWGMPRVLVSDNGTAFTSSEFSDFLRECGIIHLRTAPYHPNSNGLAVRAVRTIKEALARNSMGSIRDRLARILFGYHQVPTTGTGVSPAQAMLGWPLRSPLDLLKPGEKPPPEAQTPGPASVFPQGTEVWARNLGQGAERVPGTAVGTKGGTMVQVESPVGPLFRHADQLHGGVARPQEGTPAAASQAAPASPRSEPRDQETEEASPGRGACQEAPEAGPAASLEGAPKTSLRRSTRLRRAPDRLNF